MVSLMGKNERDSERERVREREGRAREGEKGYRELRERMEVGRCRRV